MPAATPKPQDLQAELASVPRKKLPSSLDLESLPLLSGAGGAALTPDAQRGFLYLLSAQTSFEASPLLASAIAWADPARAGELAWALFKQWESAKYSKTLSWIVYALGLLADPQCADRIEQRIGIFLPSRRKPERELAVALLPALSRAKEGPLRLLRLTRVIMGKPEEQAVEREIERVAAEQGKSVAELEEALFPLEVEILSLKDPKTIPPALKMKDAPPLVRTDGQPLEKRMVEGVLRALIKSNSTPRPIGPRLRRTLTEESRDDFAMYLLDRWKEKDFHGSYGWILDALGALGGDRTALALAPHLRGWPQSGDTGRKRAIEALSVFREIGTDTALQALMGLRQKAVAPSVVETAIFVLRSAAKDRGLSVSELADRITPDCGLDTRGMRQWSYGPRTFTLHIDDQFGLRVRDAKGELLSELPPASPGDDPALVEAAQRDWHVVSGQLEEALKVQSLRLEQDMIEGRRWPAEAWTRLLQRHPLMVHFTRRLLWGIYAPDGAFVFGFRTAEDQSLVDIDDKEVSLPKDALVGVAHPLHMDEGQRSAWIGHFADYQIIAPFPQLGRTLHTPTTDEIETTAVTRFQSTGFYSGVIRDMLVRKGWDRDPSIVRRFYDRTFKGDGVRAAATLDPGVSAGSAKYDLKDQKIPTVKFFVENEKESRSNVALRIGDVPKVAFSEALLDLYELLAEQDAEAAAAVAARS